MSLRESQDLGASKNVAGRCFGRFSLLSTLRRRMRNGVYGTCFFFKLANFRYCVYKYLLSFPGQHVSTFRFNVSAISTGKTQRDYIQRDFYIKQNTLLNTHLYNNYALLLETETKQ